MYSVAGRSLATGAEAETSLVGATLDGRYRILEPVGDGSVGTVYRARQLHVDRDVAVKVLDPRNLPGGSVPDVVSRFEAEARIVSRLRHPHTIKLLDFGRLPDGRLYLVMEYLHGRSLDRILEQGPLDERRTLRILRQAAEALAEAHQQGIIHRDLKPGNLFIDRVGEQEEVKVIDFGIAKVAAKGFRTEHGMVFGTPAYMSPEQAQGQEVDARSDLYSLGVVAYHCLTGRLPFEADTPVGLLVKAVSEPPPPLASLAPTVKVSAGLERLIMRLLAKRPEDRPASAIELREAVLALEHPSGPTAVPEMTLRMPAQRRTALRVIELAVAVALVTASAYLITASFGGGSPEADGGAPADAGPAKVTAVLRQLTDTSDLEFHPAISPDGEFVAYVSEASGEPDIYLLRVGGERPINLTADLPGKCVFPAFSPDGKQIAFNSIKDGASGLYIMGVTGEGAHRVAEGIFNPAWTPDGKALVTATEGVESALGRRGLSSLVLLDLGSGQRRELFHGDAVQPSVSPHGTRIAFWAILGGQRDIWTLDLAGGEKPVPVTKDAANDYNPVWSPDGTALFFLSDRAGTQSLWRVAIDEGSGALRGEPQPLTAGTTDMAMLSLSRNGLGVSSLVSGTSVLKAQGFDPRAEALAGEPRQLLESSRGFTGIDLSPDGKWLVGMTMGAGSDLAVVGTDGSGRRLLTNDVPKDWGPPRFSPDGSKILFQSNRSGLWQAWEIRPDGTGMRQLTDACGAVLIPIWTQDGRGVLASDTTSRKLLRYELTGAIPVKEGVPVTGDESKAGTFLAAAISPDGKRLAGTWDTGTVVRLATLELARPEPKVLEVEGSFPRWLPDSKRLLYMGERALSLTDVDDGRTKTVLDVPPGKGFGGLALSRDGTQLYYVEQRAAADLWLVTLKE